MNKWGDYDSRVAFFELLFMANNHLDPNEIGVEVRSLQTGKYKKVTSVYITEELLYPENKREFFKTLGPILEKNAKYRANVYFGPNPRNKPFDCKKGKYSLECKQGSKNTVSNSVRILFVDIDILHKEDIADLKKFELFMSKRKNRELIENAMKSMAFEIKHHLEKKGLMPFTIVYSGYGLQYLFALKTPIPKKEFQYWNKALADTIDEILQENQVVFAPSNYGIPQYLVRKPKGKKNPILKVDEKVYDVARILRLPYTRNWRYSVPAFTNLLYPEDPREFTIPFVQNSILEEKVRSIKESLHRMNTNINVNREFSGDLPRYTEYSWTASVIMGEEAKQALYEFLKKHYVSGRRHNIVLRIAGLARAFGYRPQEVIEVVQRVYRETSDEDDFNDRLRAIEDTYMKPPSSISWNPLNAITEQLLKEYPPNKNGTYSKEFENKKEEAIRDIKKLRAAFYRDIERAKEENRIDKGFEVDEEGNIYID